MTEFVAKGLVEEEIILKALSSPSANFTANPRDIVESTEYMSEFQAEQQVQKGKVATEEMFDLSVYDEAISKMQ